MKRIHKLIDYGCFSFQSMVNGIINANGYGKRSRSMANDFYIDVLFTPLVTYILKPNATQTAFNNFDIDISENTLKYYGWQAFVVR